MSELFLTAIVSDLIYRRHRPVLWSPSSVTALADAEVQYVDDHISRSAYITFRITPAGHGSSHLGKVMEEIGETDIHFLVWTTTPWTIPANMVFHLDSPTEFPEFQ